MMDAHFALKPAVAQFEYAKQELWERNISYAEKIAIGPMIDLPPPSIGSRQLSQ